MILQSSIVSDCESIGSIFFLQISPDDIQWVDEDPGISRLRGYEGSGIGLNRSDGRELVPGTGRGRGLPKVQSRKEYPPSQNDLRKKGLNDLQLLHTDSLLKEVRESN